MCFLETFLIGGVLTKNHIEVTKDRDFGSEMLLLFVGCWATHW